MRSRWLRWIAFVLFLAAVSGYEAYALFVERPDASEHVPPAPDVHLSREVRGQCQLIQTFVVHADGFSALEIFPRKSAQPPKGPMHVRISDGKTETFTKLIERDFDTASMDLNGSLRIQVPRVDDSAGRLFMLEIWMLEAERGNGLRFEQGGPTYPEGRMFIDCLGDWGDLKFRAEVQRATIFSNVQHLRRALPGALQSDLVLIVALFIANLALAMVVYALAFAPEPQAAPVIEPEPDQSPNGSAATTALQPRV
jgi:hypothetical protein